jgi:ApaG protein
LKAGVRDQYRDVAGGVDCSCFTSIADFADAGTALRTMGIEGDAWQRSDLAIIDGTTMPDLRLESAPLSEAVTENIRVEVMSSYSPENSRPTEGEWVFQYTVRITNQGREKVQLLSRHWVITDAADHIEEVRGPGVVGEQPVLGPGESFKYSSWCPLKTPLGMMHGTYQMVRPDGNHFDIEIAPFALKARYTVH